MHGARCMGARCAWGERGAWGRSARGRVLGGRGHGGARCSTACPARRRSALGSSPEGRGAPSLYLAVTPLTISIGESSLVVAQRDEGDRLVVQGPQTEREACVHRGTRGTVWLSRDHRPNGRPVCIVLLGSLCVLGPGTVRGEPKGGRKACSSRCTQGYICGS